MYVYVGGKGNTSSANPTPSSFGGGGSLAAQTNTSYVANAASGGGASDVRVLADNLYNRIIVGGGGGGANSYGNGSAIYAGDGGDGGGSTGQNGQAGTGTTYGPGFGGTQTSGGAVGVGSSGSTAGSFGFGGNNTNNLVGTSGGGGWYGGGASYAGGGAGGGSGYVLTSSSTKPTGYFTQYASYYLINDITAQLGQTGYVANPDASGNGYVKITGQVTTSCESNRVLVTATVNTTPTAPTVSVTNATCSSAGSATLSVYNSSYTYTFDPVGPSVVAGGVISDLNQSTSYTVTATLGTCESNPSSAFSLNSYSILLTPDVPTVSVTNATCSSVGSATLSIYNSSYTYTFDPVGPSVGAGGVISDLVPSTSYTVTATLGTCESNPSSAFSLNSYSILPTPVFTVSSTVVNPTTCGGSDGSLTLTGLSPNTIYNILYSKDGSVQTVISLTSDASGDLVISGLEAGTYTDFELTLGTCSSIVNSDEVILTNPVLPTVLISTTDPVTFCVGESATLSAPSSSTYQWQVNGNDISGEVGQTINVTESGSYSVSIVDVNNCSGSSSSPVDITVNPLPTVPTVSANGQTSFCSGGSVDLEADVISGLTYSWSTGDVDVYSINVTESGSYYLTVTDGNNCSASNLSSAIVVTVNPLPDVPSIIVVDPTCTTSGSASISNFDDTYIYDFIPNGPTVNSGLISGFTSNQVYTVSAKSTSTSCVSAYSQDFSIELVMFSAFAGENGTMSNICKNQEIDLFDGLSVLGNLNGNWFNSSNVPISNEITTSSSSGSYVYRYIVDNGTCVPDTATVTVSVGLCDALGLENMSSTENIQIIPNPNRGNFQIIGVTGSEYSFEILDLNGRLIEEKRYINSNITDVDLTKYENGVYIVRLFDDKSDRIYRVVKQ
jgi:hypothetical protein